MIIKKTDTTDMIRAYIIKCNITVSASVELTKLIGCVILKKVFVSNITNDILDINTDIRYFDAQ